MAKPVGPRPERATSGAGDGDKRPRAEELSPEVEVIADAARAWDELPEEIEERRMQVRDLLRHGLSYPMMARLVGCSTTTIKRDVAWLRKVGQAWAERFVDAEEVGESAALFQEIENRSMRLASMAESPFDHTEEVSEESDDGPPTHTDDGTVVRGTKVKTKKVRVLIDHAACANHLRNAMAARVQKHEMLRKAGMMKMVDLNIKVGGTLDIGKLSDEQLRQLASENARKLAEVTARIDALTRGNPLEGSDKEPWED